MSERVRKLPAEFENIRADLVRLAEAMAGVARDPGVSDWFGIDLGKHKIVLEKLEIDAESIRKCREVFEVNIQPARESINKSLEWINRFYIEEDLYKRIERWKQPILSGHQEISSTCNLIIKCGNELQYNHQKIIENISFEKIINILKSGTISSNKNELLDEGLRAITIITNNKDIYRQLEETQNNLNELGKSIELERSSGDYPIIVFDILLGFISILISSINLFSRTIDQYKKKHDATTMFNQQINDELKEISSQPLINILINFDDISLDIQERVAGLIKYSFYVDKLVNIVNLHESIVAIGSSIRNSLLGHLKSETSLNSELGPAVVAERILEAYLNGAFGMFFSILGALPLLPQWLLVDRAALKEKIIGLLQMYSLSGPDIVREESCQGCLRKARLFGLIRREMLRYQRDLTKFIGQHKVAAPSGTVEAGGEQNLGEMINTVDRRAKELLHA